MNEELFLKNWIQDAQTLNEMTELTPLALKKPMLQKIFGSNLLLSRRAVRGTAQNQWAAITAAHESGENTPLSLKLEILLNYARTSFQKLQ